MSQEEFKLFDKKVASRYLSVNKFCENMEKLLKINPYKFTNIDEIRSFYICFKIVYEDKFDENNAVIRIERIILNKKSNIDYYDIKTVFNCDHLYIKLSKQKSTYKLYTEVFRHKENVDFMLENANLYDPERIKFLVSFRYFLKINRNIESFTNKEGTLIKYHKVINNTKDYNSYYKDCIKLMQIFKSIFFPDFSQLEENNN